MPRICVLISAELGSPQAAARIPFATAGRLCKYAHPAPCLRVSVSPCLRVSSAAAVRVQVCTPYERFFLYQSMARARPSSKKTFGL